MIIDAPKIEHIKTLKKLWQEAFGDSDAFLDDFFEKVFSATRCRCVIDDGKAIAALYWFDCEYGEKKIAYLYAIATLKEYRGKGLCASLMKDTHAHLRDTGYSIAMLVPANEKLFGLYARMGYSECTFVSEKNVFPSYDDTNAVTLFRISAKEYAKRRRDLLDTEGVIQERENLVLLDMTSELYAGDELLLAVQPPTKDSEARIIELLGDTEKAPAIVRALGYESAILRTQGNEKAFAMSLALKENIFDMPRYFGLAFD